MSKEQLEDYEVTLHPKPKTFNVAANFPWEAIRIAEYNYGAGDVTAYGFDSFEIKHLGLTGESQKQ